MCVFLKPTATRCQMTDRPVNELQKQSVTGEQTCLELLKQSIIGHGLHSEEVNQLPIDELRF